MHTDLMEDYQEELFPYAYNILASAEDSRDAIQDVMTKLMAADHREIENLKAYLVKGVINQAINIKKKRRSVPPDKAWLPEPVATESSDAGIRRKEVISYSVLVLLEKLNAAERAVFILKEGFDYSHEEIGDILGVTTENSRQLLSRAKKKIGRNDLKNPVKMNDRAQRAYFERYVEVIRSNDIAALEQMLSADVHMETDGGGKIRIVRSFSDGAKDTAALLAYVFTTFQQSYSIVPAFINHQPALLYYKKERLAGCQVFDINSQTGLIERLYTIVDPDKLKNIRKYPHLVTL